MSKITTKNPFVAMEINSLTKTVELQGNHSFIELVTMIYAFMEDSQNNAEAVRNAVILHLETQGIFKPEGGRHA